MRIVERHRVKLNAIHSDYDRFQEAAYAVMKEVLDTYGDSPLSIATVVAFMDGMDQIKNMVDFEVHIDDVLDYLIKSNDFNKRIPMDVLDDLAYATTRINCDHFVPGMEKIALTRDNADVFQDYRWAMPWIESIDEHFQTVPPMSEIWSKVDPNRKGPERKLLVAADLHAPVELPKETVIVESIEDTEGLVSRLRLDQIPMHINSYFETTDHIQVHKDKDADFLPGFRVVVRNHTKRTLFVGDRRGLVWEIEPTKPSDPNLDHQVVVLYEGQPGHKTATVKDSLPHFSKLKPSKDPDQHRLLLYRPQDYGHAYLNARLISEALLEERGVREGVYEPRHDLMFSFTQSKALHPHSNSGCLNRLVAYPSAGHPAGLSFLLVDNTRQQKTLYLKVLGHVLQLVPSRHSVLENGLYIVHKTVKTEAHRAPETRYEFIQLENIHKKFGVFETYEEARDNMPLEEIERAKEREDRRKLELNLHEDKHREEMRRLQEKHETNLRQVQAEHDALLKRTQDKHEATLRQVQEKHEDVLQALAREKEERRRVDREKHEQDLQHREELHKLEELRNAEKYRHEQATEKLREDRDTHKRESEERKLELTLKAHEAAIQHSQQSDQAKFQQVARERELKLKEMEEDLEIKRRRLEQEDYYETRSYERKDTSESIKTGLSIAGGIIGAIALGLSVYDKFRKKPSEALLSTATRSVARHMTQRVVQDASYVVMNHVSSNLGFSETSLLETVLDRVVDHFSLGDVVSWFRL